MAKIVTEDKTSIQVVLPIQAKEHLEAIARERSTKGKKVFISDLVRDALKTVYGGDVSYDVDRGGDRRNTSE